MTTLGTLGGGILAVPAIVAVAEFTGNAPNWLAESTPMGMLAVVLWLILNKQADALTKLADAVNENTAVTRELKTRLETDSKK